MDDNSQFAMIAPIKRTYLVVAMVLILNLCPRPFSYEAGLRTSSVQLGPIFPSFYIKHGRYDWQNEAEVWRMDWHPIGFIFNNGICLIVAGIIFRPIARSVEKFR